MALSIITCIFINLDIETRKFYFSNSYPSTYFTNNAPINSKHQHPPPPGKPRAFECLLCPGSREFDLKGHPGGGEFDFA